MLEEGKVANQVTVLQKSSKTCLGNEAAGNRRFA
jgi:hypothetical protein